MIRLASRVTPFVAGFLLFASESPAAPVVWDTGTGANGHSYEFVVLDYTTSWTQANAAAGLLTLNGDVGYLAALTWPEEQAFVQSAVLPTGGANKNQVWIGGKQDPEPIDPVTGNPSTPSLGWQWMRNLEVSPEAWSYTNWLTENEPSNDGQIDERFLTMWVHYYQAGLDLRGKWNDEQSVAPATARIIGMIVEYGVPEPATASLSALGVALLALYRRRR